MTYTVYTHIYLDIDSLCKAQILQVGAHHILSHTVCHFLTLA